MSYQEFLNTMKDIQDNIVIILEEKVNSGENILIFERKLNDIYIKVILSITFRQCNKNFVIFLKKEILDFLSFY